MQEALKATKILAEDCRNGGTAFRLGVCLFSNRTGDICLNIYISQFIEVLACGGWTLIYLVVLEVESFCIQLKCALLLLSNMTVYFSKRHSSLHTFLTFIGPKLLYIAKVAYFLMSELECCHILAHIHGVKRLYSLFCSITINL